MKRLDSGDYLVPAIRAAEAIDLVRSRVSSEEAEGCTALSIDLSKSEVGFGAVAPHPQQLWLVHPHWRTPSQWDDHALADHQWVSKVTPVGWNVVVEAKLNLLIIRNTSRSLCMIESMPSDLLFRGRLRCAFAKLGIFLED